MNNYPKKKRSLETEIVDLFAKGDERAIPLVYKNYSANLYGVITQIVKQEELAKEVLQDTFIKIWKNAKSYDQKKGRIFTWMLNIARRSAIDATRTAAYKKGHKTDSMDAPTYHKDKGTTETYIEDSGLKKIIGTLDDKYKEIIDLIYFQGYTHRDVEKELEIPLGTVKSRVRSAIKQLREKLSDEGGNSNLELKSIIAALIISTI